MLNTYLSRKKFSSFKKSRLKHSRLPCIILIALSLNAYAEAPDLSVRVLAAELKLSWTPTDETASYRLYYAPSPYEGPNTVNSIDLGKSLSISGLLPEGASFLLL